MSYTEGGPADREGDRKKTSKDRSRHKCESRQVCLALEAFPSHYIQ